MLICLFRRFSTVYVCKRDSCGFGSHFGEIIFILITKLFQLFFILALGIRQNTVLSSVIDAQCFENWAETLYKYIGIDEVSLQHFRSIELMSMKFLSYFVIILLLIAAFSDFRFYLAISEEYSNKN